MLRYRLLSVLSLVMLVVILGLIALVIYRPATILGVHSDALAHSLKGEIGRADAEGDCRELEGDDWICTIGELEGQRRAVVLGYRVTTKDYGCWDAVLQRGAATDSSAVSRTDGCINILDFVRVF